MPANEISRFLCDPFGALRPALWAVMNDRIVLSPDNDVAFLGLQALGVSGQERAPPIVLASWSGLKG